MSGGRCAKMRLGSTQSAAAAAEVENARGAWEAYLWAMEKRGGGRTSVGRGRRGGGGGLRWRA